jgi:hypothetical protein
MRSPLSRARAPIWTLGPRSDYFKVQVDLLRLTCFMFDCTASLGSSTIIILDELHHRDAPCLPSEEDGPPMSSCVF